MATESEKAELARLASGASPLVQVVQFPKFAEILGKKMPYAAAELRDLDEKIEVWRKSVLAQRTEGGSLPTPSTP